MRGEEPPHHATDTCNLINISGCSAPMTSTPVRGTYAGVGTPGILTKNPRNVSIPYPTGRAWRAPVLVVVKQAGRGASMSKGLSGWATIDKPLVGVYLAVALRR